MSLKKNKMQESQVAKLQAARATIQSQMMAIENASMNMDLLNALKSGSRYMEERHRRGVKVG